jgi:hypothetical protein
VYSSRTGQSKRRSSVDDKGSWRIKIKVPDVKQEHDYSVVDFESRNSSDSIVRSTSRSASRPKLRSIVITQAARGTGRHEAPVDSSHDKPQKRLTKKGQSHRQDEAVKKMKDELIKLENQLDASPSTSSSSYLHPKGCSQLSHSAHKYNGSSKCSSKSSSRQKHGKKDKEKVKSKRQKDSHSSAEWKSHGLKSKKRKRISSFSDSSDDFD